MCVNFQICEVNALNKEKVWFGEKKSYGNSQVLSLHEK